MDHFRNSRRDYELVFEEMVFLEGDVGWIGMIRAFTHEFEELSRHEDESVEAQKKV